VGVDNRHGHGENAMKNKTTIDGVRLVEAYATAKDYSHSTPLEAFTADVFNPNEIETFKCLQHSHHERRRNSG